jgi:hypothetical protein
MTCPDHDRLKRSTADWNNSTTPIGTQYDAAGPRLELANCNRCGSTLGRPHKDRHHARP